MEKYSHSWLLSLSILESSTKEMILRRELEDTIKTFHKYCDPCDMTYEDHLVWEAWNKKFHPENYDEVNESGS